MPPPPRQNVYPFDHLGKNISNYAKRAAVVHLVDRLAMYSGGPGFHTIGRPS